MMAIHASARRIKPRDAVLPTIPVIGTGPDFPVASLRSCGEKTHALLDVATRRYPKSLLKSLDRVSRVWLARSDNGHLREIDTIAEELGRPGAYFFSINYEWGCTCRAAPSPETNSARLIRVLDWQTPGLGGNLVCAKVEGAPAGPFAVLTWPGYTGVLQVMAPGRFSAALNQAPMRDPTGLFYVDWAANRHRVWKMPFPTPAHLLRRVAEEAKIFDEACRLLSDALISTPGIFTIAGVAPEETAVIERTEHDARIRRGDGAVAANHWGEAGWRGQARGDSSFERAQTMQATAPSFDADFAWLAPPVLNDKTRLAMIADAKLGRLVARGYEADGAATQSLDFEWHASV
ncbi:MAG: hypothetical protein QM780_17305 [Hyphomicrobium sp.]|uniref:hypothetical protein n=1 Tax=Hyphomicrobium sp. TaxID=82 RepID=UPI0039E70D3D